MIRSIAHERVRTNVSIRTGLECRKRAELRAWSVFRAIESHCATLATITIREADTPVTIDKLAWVHVVERKLLVVRSHAREMLYLPGGKRDAGESDQQALIREIREELSIELKPASILPAGVFCAQADAMPDGVDVRMTCYRSDFDGRLQIAHEIAEMRWLDSTDRTQFSAVGRQVLDQLVEQGVID